MIELHTLRQEHGNDNNAAVLGARLRYTCSIGSRLDC